MPGITLRGLLGAHDHQTKLGFYRAVTTTLATDTRLQRWVYYGDVIATSRPWCRRFAGQIKTRAEWDALWRNNTWAGKNGSVFQTDAGGHRCRHHASPVPLSLSSQVTEIDIARVPAAAN